MSSSIPSSTSASATTCTTPSLADIVRASAERRKRRFPETKSTTSNASATTATVAAQTLAATQSTTTTNSASSNNETQKELGHIVLHAKRKRQKLAESNESTQNSSSSNSSSSSFKSSTSESSPSVTAVDPSATAPVVSDEEWAKIWNETPATTSSWDNGSAAQEDLDVTVVSSSEPLDTYEATTPTVKLKSGTVIGTVIFPESLGEGLVNCEKDAIVNTIILGRQGLKIDEYVTDAFSITVRAGTTINSLIFSSPAGGTVTCEKEATVKEITNGTRT